MKQTITWMLCFTLLVSMAGCTTFEPKVAKQQPYLSEECQLVTRKLYLNEHRIKSSRSTMRAICSDPSLCIAYLVGSGVWTASSLVVSGSLTATGNIVHWMEYQGRCDTQNVSEPLLSLDDYSDKSDYSDGFEESTQDALEMGI